MNSFSSSSTGANNPLKAILLDAEGTFLHINPSVGYVYAKTLERFGLEVDHKIVEERFVSIWKTKKYAPKRQIGKEANYQFWKEIFLDATSPLIQIHEPDLVFNACYHEFSKAKWWKLSPGFEYALKRWRETGLRIGVVSNWDERLRALLRDMNLEDYFHALIISAEVGLEKPDPAIVEMACEVLEVTPESSLFIGDVPDIDLEAASRAGCRALLYDPKDRYPEIPCRFKAFDQLASFDQSLEGLTLCNS